MILSLDVLTVDKGTMMAKKSRKEILLGATCVEPLEGYLVKQIWIEFFISLYGLVYFYHLFIHFLNGSFCLLYFRFFNSYC